ncbi:PAS domain-containing sensor histidine kinase [Flavobacterium sp. SM15]|uniref:PAS domain-containing sensor histidine kinase n=1 Tax=Flavobacterium sp. SM15 TaxID=2908005 RepID=UPI001EDC805F|nr:PAS domain-containing sensor histidine kinase [Flavobacterium sp. SM15]MCG2612310.1 PAS domain-containing sensor histidine kinase [Flavobacterium sp. SM15]
MHYIYYKSTGMVEGSLNIKLSLQNELNLAKNKYSVFDRMIEGVQVINYKWQYIYVNDSIAKQGVSTKKELLGSTMMERYPGIENSAMFDNLKLCMFERLPSEIISEFDFPDKSKGWFELSIQPVHEGILILSTDITKLKRTEAELKKKLLERTQLLSLITAQKKQLEEFCQIIAHNLRAPLSNLIHLNEIIDECNDDQERHNYLKIQGSVINQFQKSFEELVDATRIRMDLTIKKQHVSLTNEIEDVLKNLAAEISETKVKITHNFNKVPTIQYPKKYLHSIFKNLISNSIKYSLPEKIIKIHISSYIKDDWICIDVKDNGLGINLKKHKNDLFKLHKTFHGNPDAKGFGLFLTKTQVEAMGGEIVVKSQINKGSTFTVNLYKMNPDEEN